MKSRINRLFYVILWRVHAVQKVTSDMHKKERTVRFALFNRPLLLGFLIVLLAILAPFAYLAFANWGTIPLAVRILVPTLLVVTGVGLLSVLFCGVWIGRKRVLVIPDMRIIVAARSKLRRIAVNFNQWDNGRYSVTIKLLYRDGRLFTMDSSRQFRNARRKKLLMACYTISERNRQSVCDRLSEIDGCIVTVVDRAQKIVYQSGADRIGCA